MKTLLTFLFFAYIFVEKTSTGSVLWGVTKDKQWYMLLDKKWIKVESPLKVRKKMKDEYKNKSWIEKVFDK